ncbi:DUF1990 domain-containing protein [Streptomyces sp. NPDC001941]|uniref:DUF1990 family protein n=1 Tax=Streptomyces sp. NPDC001941 TaxID=3154659 RepID=UPI003325CEF2
MTRLIRSLSTPATPLSYPDVGATLRRPLPDGYHHLHHAVRVGHGRGDLERAGAAVTTFAVHRSAGCRVRTAALRAEPGAVVEVALAVGPLALAAPCEVVWAEYGERRTGFAYGTRAGHPECGEESFVVELRADGSVWFTVTAFSRPAAWYTRLAGPVVPALQHWYARRLGRTLARLVARG